MIDEDGNEGKVTCAFNSGDDNHSHAGRKKKKSNKRKTAVCPVASSTIERALEYKMDNSLFLRDFERVLEKMVNNGYSEADLRRADL